MQSITLKVDLYDYKQVEKVCRLAAEKLGLRSDLIEMDLYQITEQLEAKREKAMLEKGENTRKKVAVPTADAGACTTFLSKSKLIDRFNELIGKMGIVGEENNRLLVFVVASSYKMPDPLHVLIQGSSGSGKTRLLRIISDLMPPEDVSRYTRVTDQALYNQPEGFFIHRLVCFEDLDGLKEDAQMAARELVSGDELRSAVSIKDQHGRITGGEKIVKGPIGSISCTTKGWVYEDNISRCFVIAVDESREQTLRIIEHQNRKAGGQVSGKEQAKIRSFVQNCIRLLKPYEVINPYWDKIELPHDADHLRRLNELYQCFVKQITLLNQYQREKDAEGRLITQKEDLEIACEILFESIVLKVDDLEDGSLRQFFEKLKNYVLEKGKHYEFTQREVRQQLQMSKARCSRYFKRLQEYEYLSSNGYNLRKLAYKIEYWDNYELLRKRIKTDLENQIKALK